MKVYFNGRAATLANEPRELITAGSIGLEVEVIFDASWMGVSFSEG